ncbi:hypothetical protein [Dyadobacter sp. NIV53]|uniref:hypothetical protein n=1 Tax=Dyadobacter sp. NIV53 TaxID=2861765 RepID=UPI001C884A4F|nr:hypothetical protein [Dyadobacter sp. NIV53]
MTKEKFEFLSCIPGIKGTSQDLPFHQKNPFDRILSGTAQIKELSIMTTDPKIHLYDASLLVWLTTHII